MTILNKYNMLKGKIQRDNGNLFSGYITYFGDIIQNGLEFKLSPYKIPVEEHYNTNTKLKDPYVNYIKKLFDENKLKTDFLKIKKLSKDAWEVSLMEDEYN